MTNVFVGKHSELTDKILECCWIVYQELGYGFNEKAYEKALAIVNHLKGSMKWTTKSKDKPTENKSE